MKLLYIVLFIPIFLQAEIGYVEPWGKDSDLKVSVVSPPQKPVKKNPMVWLSEKVIRFHQNVISKVDGPRSHYRPSSSQYMLLAMEKHGFIKGFLMGCDRLLRENDEEWVYKTITENGKTFKYDPPPD
jgi:putative component of membrane protein insertase Oxa1/YidC/SpoIIIJ protein YidD